MGQIPNRERPGRVGAGGERRHVVAAAGAVIHLREQQRRHLFIDVLGNLGRRHQPQLVADAEDAQQGAGDVEIRREVAGVGEHHAPFRAQLQRRVQGLMHLDGEGVADDDGARRRTEQAA